MSKKGHRAGLRLRSGENDSTVATLPKRRRTSSSTMEGNRNAEDQPQTTQMTRQQHYKIQNQWIASSIVPAPQPDDNAWNEDDCDEVDGDLLAVPRSRPSADIDTATTTTAVLGKPRQRFGKGDSPPVESFRKFRSLDFQMRFQNVFTTPTDSVQSPLPRFNWAESQDVWRNMLKKDEKFQRDGNLFKNHPELQPRMRSILMDWLSEVCEVYRLHKETFALAIDYIDRYLSVTTNVPKTQLQLLGISALFIAAKLEEIYPPKLAEFAYVTDSACTEKEIIKQEMIIVKALKWDLTPMTTNSWLTMYLQVANVEHIHDPALGFVFPQFSTHAFTQISRLCDLCMMDAGSLQFRFGVIAAAALYHHTNEHLVKEVSGLNWADLFPCVRWMAPFAKSILEVGQAPIKFFPQIPSEDAHNIQTHNVDMALLDRAQTHQAEMAKREGLSSSSNPPDLTSQLSSLLEPPFPQPTACSSSSHLLTPQHHMSSTNRDTDHQDRHTGEATQSDGNNNTNTSRNVVAGSGDREEVSLGCDEVDSDEMEQEGHQPHRACS